MDIPGEEPYRVEHQEVINLLDVGSINVGKKIPVMVDPQNSKNFQLILWWSKSGISGKHEKGWCHLWSVQRFGVPAFSLDPKITVNSWKKTPETGF
jgi:hypothetical protein